MTTLKIVSLVFAGISLAAAIVALIFNMQVGKYLKMQEKKLEQQERELAEQLNEYCDECRGDERNNTYTNSEI